MESRQHVHHWITTSRHATIEGPITYEHCGCGQWRVRRQTSVRLDQTVALAPARTVEPAHENRPISSLAYDEERAPFFVSNDVDQFRTEVRTPPSAR